MFTKLARGAIWVRFIMPNFTVTAYRYSVCRRAVKCGNGFRVDSSRFSETCGIPQKTRIPWFSRVLRNRVKSTSLQTVVVCCSSCSHAEFFGGLQVAAPLEDTCVEIWTVDGDNYQSVFGKYMANTFDTYTFTANVGTIRTLFVKLCSNRLPGTAISSPEVRPNNIHTWKRSLGW